MIGGPGLGYAKDRFASAHLETANPAAYAEYKVTAPSGWLFFQGIAAINGRKLGQVQAKLAAARRELAQAGSNDPQKALERLTAAERDVLAASIAGDRRTLTVDAASPAAMAAIYLGLLCYFRSRGGYKALHLEATSSPEAERDLVR
jgi:hypothetical protein